MLTRDIGMIGLVYLNDLADVDWAISCQFLAVIFRLVVAKLRGYRLEVPQSAVLSRVFTFLLLLGFPTLTRLSHVVVIVWNLWQLLISLRFLIGLANTWLGISRTKEDLLLSKKTAARRLGLLQTLKIKVDCIAWGFVFLSKSLLTLA